MAIIKTTRIRGVECWCLLFAVSLFAGCGGDAASDEAQAGTHARGGSGAANSDGRDWTNDVRIGSGRTGRPTSGGVASVERTRDDIFLERMRVETLFITEDGKRVEQPMHPSGGVVVDAEAGEVAWFAWQCNNPQCPRRRADGSPHLFSRPYPFYSISPDGSLVLRPAQDDAETDLLDDFGEHRCPECLKTRDLASETDEERAQFNAWCKPHVLPSAARRLKDLEAEHRAIVARERSRRE